MPSNAVLTLELMLALAHRGPAMEAARADTLAAEAREDSARSLTQPQLTARVGVSLAPGRAYRVPLAGTGDPTAGVSPDFVYVNGSRGIDDFNVQARSVAAVGVDYVLYDFGQTRAKRRMAGFAREAADRAAEATLEAVDRAVGGAYFNWMAAVVVAESAHDEAEAARIGVRDLTKIVAEGGRPPADMDDALAEEARAAINESRAEADADAARAALERLVGALASDARPDVDATVAAMPTDPPAGVRSAAAGGPLPDAPSGLEDALRARASAKAAEAEALQRAHRPVVGASANVGVNGSNDRFFPAWDAGVALKVPLWDGGRLDADARAAEAEARRLQADSDRQAMEDAATRRAAEAALASAEVRAQVATTLAGLSEKVLAHAQERMRLGLVSRTEVTRSQAEARRARLERTLAAIDAAAARFRLRVLGAALASAGANRNPPAAAPATAP